MKPQMLSLALYVAELSGGDVEGIQRDLLDAVPNLPACRCGSYALRNPVPNSTEAPGAYCVRCGISRFAQPTPQPNEQSKVPDHA